MSHPARAPRSGIDGQANAAGGCRANAGVLPELPQAARMSHPARAPRSGIDGQANAAGRSGLGALATNGIESERCRRVSTGWLGVGMSLADGVGSATSVRPGRGRTRVKTGQDEKIKKPADNVRKKSPPARKAPTRGRYVDEYARPSI